MNVMRMHARRKTTLEVVFQGEEGHGAGVTAEFYSLVSTELQRKDLGMWLWWLARAHFLFSSFSFQ